MSVPASDENRFMILASIIVIFCMNFAAFLFVKNMLILKLRYWRIKYAIRYVNYAELSKMEFSMNPEYWEDEMSRIQSFLSQMIFILLDQLSFLKK